MNWTALYEQQYDDRLVTINRCYTESEQGWTGIAVQRLTEALRRFPDDPQMLFALGQIREQFLGQGLAARELFARAYASDHDHPLAAANTATLAGTESEFRELVGHAAATLNGKNKFVMIELVTDALQQHLPYESAILEVAAQYQRAGAMGQCAALLDVAREHPSAYGLVEDVQLYRQRAQALRRLDEEAARARETRAEFFDPDERLTLPSAIAEVEQALILDPYDAELWNLKAAWLILLDRHLEALPCTDRAIALRPRGYAKPHQTKAAALRGLTRREEARQSALTARDIGLSQGFAGINDVELADQVLSVLDIGEAPPGDVQIKAIIEHVARAANLTALKLTEEAKAVTGVTPEQVTMGLQGRLLRASPEWNGHCIPIVVEFLYDFIPEVCVHTAALLARRSEQASQLFGDAMLYIVMHAEGVLRRDAARFIALRMLWVGDSEDPSTLLATIRRAYRTTILIRSVTIGPDCQLAASVGEQLRRLSPDLFRAIAQQEPVRDDELRAAGNTLSGRFTDAGLARLRGFARLRRYFRAAGRR